MNGDIDESEIKRLDEAELAQWLKEKDIPREFCRELESHTNYVACVLACFLFV